MKLRLTQPGYETYTGQMGTVFFEDGMSTADVKPNDAVRMAAQFLCAWEDGTTASVAQSILDHAHATTGTVKQEVNADQALREEARHAATLRDVEIPVPGAVSASAITTAKHYTAAELSDIADKDGIKGLRVIGDALGIKSNSISEMVRMIQDKQGA